VCFNSCYTAFDCCSINFCRFVEQTTKHIIHRVNSLLLNAIWRALREDTDFIWTILVHANVRVNLCTKYMVWRSFLLEYLSLICVSVSLPVIPLCVDTELVQFPLRMRDWLKNVLLQLYEHDSMSLGLLTPKQRFRVRSTTQINIWDCRFLWRNNIFY